MSSEQNALGKRPKNNVEAVLQSYKRCKIDKATRTWDWANKELVATTNLQEGSKIYVKFDVETTYIPGDDDDENDEGEGNGGGGDDVSASIVGGSAKDEANDSRTGGKVDVKAAGKPGGCNENDEGLDQEKSQTRKVEEEEEGRPERVRRSPKANSRRLESNVLPLDGQSFQASSFLPGGIVTATITIEEDNEEEEDDEDDAEISSRVERDASGKMIRVVNEQVVWWPAVIKRASTPTCASLRETWAALENDSAASSQLTPTLRKELGTMVHERGDAPIWNIKYEPREEYDKEEDLEWCAFFVDAHTLVHLEKGKVCIAPYKRALEDGTCPEDSIANSQGSDVCALEALSAAIGVMENSVLSEMSSSDPADSGHTARNSIEFAGKFGGLLKGFFAEMAQTSDRVVTPGDVWKFFDRFLTTSDGERIGASSSSSTAGESLINRTSTQSSEQASGKNDDLEEAPFPRLPESP